MKTETKNWTEENDQRYCSDEERGRAIDTRRTIQEMNHRRNEEYYNNAAQCGECSKQQQQQGDGPPF